MKEELTKTLNQEFPSNFLRTIERYGTDGKKMVFTYIPAKHVIDRLNECFKGEWSFTVTDKLVYPELNQVAVHGTLMVNSDDGKIVKEQWGGSSIDRTVNGRVISLGDNLKAATTDALKKCATMLGIGLYLYVDDVKESPTEAEKEDVAGLQGQFPSKPAEKSDGKKCTAKQAEGIRSMLEGIGMEEGAFTKILYPNDGLPPELEELTAEEAGQILTLKHPVWSRIPKRPEPQVK